MAQVLIWVAGISRVYIKDQLLVMLLRLICQYKQYYGSPFTVSISGYPAKTAFKCTPLNLIFISCFLRFKCLV